ncbi:hypothetical protein [Chryseobacterium hagamense]|uniref:Uncharacterized protein n=1 Tax=Chryseobacterium hagamense TaxID=395935 RepID=A0A511YRS6_9FLAO|nr:hypothetical protein [Chryseobacterium hagamense]GEN77895.1 hypothetical protein CHA01nite_36350 [Chryseobacterium hagamense]
MLLILKSDFKAKSQKPKAKSQKLSTINYQLSAINYHKPKKQKMKNKKRDFGARFWSGTRKHSAIDLLETFFQFNDPAEVKHNLSIMMQCSVRQKSRILKDPAEVFHLHQSLRSLIRAARLIGKKSKKGKFQMLPENHSPMLPGFLSAEEYQNPVKVFREAFQTGTLHEYDNFLSAVVYFSLGDARCEEERRIIIPYIQLIKILDAAWLIVKRTSTKK